MGARSPFVSTSNKREMRMPRLGSVHFGGATPHTAHRTRASERRATLRHSNTTRPNNARAVHQPQAVFAFTRYCHCQYCMVHGIRKGGSWGVVCCAIDVQYYCTIVGNASGGRQYKDD